MCDTVRGPSIGQRFCVETQVRLVPDMGKSDPWDERHKRGKAADSAAARGKIIECAEGGRHKSKENN